MSVCLTVDMYTHHSLLVFFLCAGLPITRPQHFRHCFEFIQALESETNYKQCVSEANKRQEELIKVKHEVLLKLRELMLQCDQTMKVRLIPPRPNL